MAEPDILWPTPQGIYYSVTDPSETPQKRLIRDLLLQSGQGPVRYDREGLSPLLEGAEGGAKLLEQLIRSSWLQLLEEPPEIPSKPYEELLKELLAPLGDRRVLLLEEEGFYLASKGFPHEIAEHLAALGADLLRVYEHHRDLLEPMLKVGTQAWSLVDAAGLSRLGFWPIYLDGRRFGLVVEGVPMLNHPNFVLLVWQLLLRYSQSGQGGVTPGG